MCRLDEKTGTRLRFHLIVDPPSVKVIEEARSAPYKVQGMGLTSPLFEWSKYKRNPELTISAPVNSRKGNLSAEANFARFYLTEMLPFRCGEGRLSRCRYRGSARTSRIYMIPSLTQATSCHGRRRGIEEIQAHVRVLARLSQHAGPKSVKILWALMTRRRSSDTFNAGVLVLHLKRWARARLHAGRSKPGMKWNKDLRNPCTNWGLYKLGKQSPR